MKRTVEERLLDYAVREEESGCLVWVGCCRNGYGALSVNNAPRYAHRLAYEIWIGPIPTMGVVHHACGNKLCIEPTHLQAVGQHENTAEMLERTAYLRRIAELEEQLASCACGEAA